MQKFLILLLSALSALAPLSIDAYLPAMPAMGQDFGVSIHDIELSLSIYLGGFAIGQILGGPLSDHFGRRAGISMGLILFSLGTVPIIFANSIDVLWGFRFLQAIGSGIAVVNTSAIIRDLSSGQESARNLAHVAVIMMLAPLLAPLLGTVILHLSGWRAIFSFLLTYGLVIAVLAHFTINETRIQTTHKTPTLQRYWQVFSHREALGYLFSMSLAYSAMFTFITSSPSVYMGYFAISEAAYPFLFGANVIGMILINRLNVHLLQRIKSHQLLIIGQTIQFILASLLFLYIFLSATPSIYIVAPLIILFVGSLSFIVSNAMAGAIEHFPHNSATATALLGACSFGLSALVGALVSAIGDGTPKPMAMIIFACALLAPLLRWIVTPKLVPVTEKV